MKKISPKQKYFLIKKSKAGLVKSKSHYTRLARRSNVSKKKEPHNEPARKKFLQHLRALPSINIDNDTSERFVFLDPPKDFSLIHNYERTLSFLMELRRHFSTNPEYLNSSREIKAYFASFHKIEKIEPAAGLVLAAEMHRFKQAYGKKPISFDHIWKTNVKDFFHEIGLFDLLEIDARSLKEESSEAEPKKTVQIINGSLAEGSKADLLRERLQTISGKHISDHATMYAAITEAMTNVCNHAYPSRAKFWPTPQPELWWITAVWRPLQGKATILLYDQGVGFPQTLKRRPGYWNAIKAFITERTDAAIIAAAMEYGRSGTNKANRGKGLPQMLALTQSTPDSYLRILSGKGLFVAQSNGKITKVNNRVPFLGTLVEWEINLNG